MEVEIPSVTYQFQVTGNDEILKLNKDLLPYFPTLTNLVLDLGANEHNIIPLIAELQLPILKWAFEAANIIHIHTDVFIETLDQLYALRDGAELTLFGPNTLPIVKNIALLVRTALTLDWLDSKKLLLLTLKKLYTLIDTLPTSILEEWPLRKRKFTEEELNPGLGLPLTPFFKREELIHRVLGELLPAPLIRSRYNVERVINPIALGSSHQLFLKRDGLYGNDRNHKGQLGLPIPETNLYYDQVKLEMEGTPLLIACGANHSLCLTSEGLYGTGDNSNGQLGLEAPIIGKWTLIPIEGEVLLLTTSDTHSVILTTSGLYTSGANQFGQLGLNDKDSRSLFSRVEGVQFPVLRVRCAKDVTFISTLRGIYACGYNRHGLMSDLNVDGQFLSFRLITQLPSNSLRDMACSSTHFMMATKEALYGCGLNSKGELGIVGQNQYNTLKELNYMKDKDVQLIGCDNFFTFILIEIGLYSTGANNSGRLGVGNWVDRRFFSKVAHYEGKVQSLTIKENTVLFLTTDGLYGIGALPHPKYANITNIPLKLEIDMGYKWEFSVRLPIEEIEHKRTRLYCQHCQSEALYIKNKVLPVCSKYCLLLSENRLITG